GVLLDTLKGSSVIMGIISNAQFYTPLLFSAHLGAGLEDLGFRKDLIFFSYELGYCKPSSTAFKKAARTLMNEGIEPGQALYLGNDILKDIIPAGEAGLQTVLFAGDARSLNLREDDDRCRGIIPDMIVTSLSQVIDYLE
ncbi:MAG: hypothetical protein PHU03_07930, partial [Syntrophales bacterium]|nr:hypothetical protein [Syntrophales bacterium]